MNARPSRCRMTSYAMRARQTAATMASAPAVGTLRQWYPCAGASSWGISPGWREPTPAGPGASSPLPAIGGYVSSMLTAPPQRWDREFDLVVLGSGAAGLTAAILAHDGGARVLVLEKARLIGGTTGVSGGMPWIPLNRHMAELGVSDSREEPLSY